MEQVREETEANAERLCVLLMLGGCLDSSACPTQVLRDCVALSNVLCLSVFWLLPA